MEALTTLLKFWDIAIGILISVGGLLLGGFTIWDRRVRGYISQSNAAHNTSALSVSKRLDAVERQMSEIDADLVDVRRQVDTMEGKMSALATKEDVARVTERMAHAEGMMNQIGGQVDTLYRALMRTVQ